MRSVTLIISFCLVISVLAILFADHSLSYIIVSAIGSSAAVFRIFSGKKVKEISFDQDIITVWKYNRPFRLERFSYHPDNIYLQQKRKVVGKASTAKYLQAEDTESNSLFVISSELLLWNDRELEEIHTFFNGDVRS